MTRLGAVVVTLLPLACGVARAQDLQSLEKKIEDQQRQIDELRAMKGGSASAAATNDKDKAADDTVHWKELRVGDSKFKIYGFLRLDAIYDDSRPNNTQTVGFILSEDPAAPAGSTAGHRNKPDFTMHPRLTRFGIDFDGPTVSGLSDAKLTGKLEVDFYNNGLQPQAESREALRLRHGWLRMGWDDFSILAGQTNDVISPLFPIVNPDFVMWGAGNLGDRRPQLRAEYAPKIDDDSKVISQGEIGLTGANDNQDLDAAGANGSGFRDGETSGLPTFQGRLAYATTVDKQPLEVGAWGHYAWDKPDTQFGGKNRFSSYALGIDYKIPVYEDRLWVKGELWTGANLSDVRGGILQGINKTTGEEIAARGGWAEVGFKPETWWTLAAGWSTDDPDNNDLPSGARSLNRIWYLATRFQWKPVEMGVDFLHWKTEYQGFGDGTDNRVQAFVSYSF
ncbi:MAG: hypothetical protein HY292_11895 [Planctomycetes bacterium]|nr:hypothetical protein [Planctomycetota bacterium]